MNQITDVGKSFIQLAPVVEKQYQIQKYIARYRQILQGNCSSTTAILVQSVSFSNELSK